jgi:hypothetical protein
MARLKISTSDSGSIGINAPFRVVIKQQKLFGKGLPTLNTNALKSRIRYYLNKEMEEIKKKLDKTIQEWDGDKPTWKKTTHVYENIASDTTLIANAICLKNTDFGSQKWFWLNDGTDIRWAAMSPEFRRKTQPGRLTSTPGKGPYDPIYRGLDAFAARGIVYTGHRKSPVMGSPKPRPGIKARRWSGIVMDGMPYVYDTMLKMIMINAEREMVADITGSPFVKVKLSDMPTRIQSEAATKNAVAKARRAMVETSKSIIRDNADVSHGDVSIITGGQTTGRKNIKGGLSEIDNPWAGGDEE